MTITNDDIRSALDSLESINTSQLDDIHKHKLEITKRFLPFLTNNPAIDYLNLCPYSTEFFLQNIKSDSQESNSLTRLDKIFDTLYRCAKERHLRTEQYLEIERPILFYYEEFSDKLNDYEKDKKLYNDAFITASRLRIDDKNTTDFKTKILSVIDEKKAELSACTKGIEDAQKKLNNLRQELNFFGLAKAFLSMLKSKTTEKNISLVFSIFLALLPLSIPVLPYLLQHIYGIQLFTIDKDQGLLTLHNAIKIIPLITIEIISIYYFRIILQQYYNAKGQILQLRLRASICEFIEEYGNFIKDKELSENNYFKQFEALIFSPLVSSPDQIPNTLDGIEQLGKMIKSCIPK